MRWGAGKVVGLEGKTSFLGNGIGRTGIFLVIALALAPTIPVNA